MLSHRLAMPGDAAPAAELPKASLTAEIKQLEKDLKSSQDSQKEATAIREKENADYTSTREQSEQTIGALFGQNHAISGFDCR